MRDYFYQEFPPQAQTTPSRFLAQSPLVRGRFLLGLSGGIDSSVATFLAVQAVGIDSVLPVTMPSWKGDRSSQMAALVRSSLQFPENNQPYEIDLTEVVEGHMAALNVFSDPQLALGSTHATQTKEQHMRSGNFGSRAKVAILYDLQRAIRGRILGTSDRPEYCQGYSAKFGTPISYDFGVLDELYKVDIYEIARLLDVPPEIRDAPPSTGYFEGQTHEGELGATIEEQDALAYLLFEKQLSVAEVISDYKVDEKIVALMHKRFVVSQHKRDLMRHMRRVHLSYSSLLM